MIALRDRKLFRLGPAREEALLVIFLMTKLGMNRAQASQVCGISEATFCRLLAGSLAESARLSGMSSCIIPQVFQTLSSVALIAQTLIFRLRTLHYALSKATEEVAKANEQEEKGVLKEKTRRALAEKEEARRVLEEEFNELRNVECVEAIGRLTIQIETREVAPQTPDHWRDRFADSASLSELRGHVALYDQAFEAADEYMFDSFSFAMKHALAGGISGPIVVARSCANTVYACAEIDKHMIKSDLRIGGSWRLKRMFDAVQEPRIWHQVMTGIYDTCDERIPANLAHLFALGNELEKSAQMVRVGLRCAREGTHWENWQPRGFDTPVIEEPYMKKVKPIL